MVYNAEPCISPDQVTTSINPSRVRIFSPRGQTATVLLWMCDANPPLLKEDSVSIDNGFSQWIQDSSGNFINPTDRTDAPACKIVGYK